MAVVLRAGLFGAGVCIFIVGSAAARAVWRGSWSKTGQIPVGWTYGAEAWTFLQRATPTLAVAALFMLVAAILPMTSTSGSHVMNDPTVSVWWKATHLG